jgi:hypothetical protein
VNQVINPTYAQANPAVVSFDSAPITSPFGAFAAYAFTTTTPGRWTLRIANPGPASLVAYRVQVNFESALTLTTNLDKDTYPLNSNLQLTAIVSSPVPITNVVAIAQVHWPNSAASSITLTAVNTKTFTRTIVMPSTTAGYGVVIVQVTGFANGTPFAREAYVEFLIPTNGAKLMGRYIDRPTDFTGVTYRTLSFDARLTVTTPSTYTLSADLLAGNQVIAHGQTKPFLVSGTPTVTIAFSGDAIRAGQVNGPYTVSNVILIDSSSYSALADSADDVWTTPAYRYTQFGTPSRVYLPLVIR